MCLNVSTSDNFYLSWYLQGAGHYNLAERHDFCPPYLRAESFQKLKVIMCGLSAAVVWSDCRSRLVRLRCLRITSSVLRQGMA